MTTATTIPAGATWRPLPPLPTQADATQCATCNQQGRIYQRDPDGVYRPWLCEACGGTGRRT